MCVCIQYLYLVMAWERHRRSVNCQTGLKNERFESRPVVIESYKYLQFPRRSVHLSKYYFVLGKKSSLKWWKTAPCILSVFRFYSSSCIATSLHVFMLAEDWYWKPASLTSTPEITKSQKMAELDGISTVYVQWSTPSENNNNKKKEKKNNPSSNLDSYFIPKRSRQLCHFTVILVKISV